MTKFKTPELEMVPKFRLQSRIYICTPTHDYQNDPAADHGATTDWTSSGRMSE